jgi:hypothetical protein
MEAQRSFQENHLSELAEKYCEVKKQRALGTCASLSQKFQAEPQIARGVSGIANLECLPGVFVDLQATQERSKWLAAVTAAHGRTRLRNWF